jgi:hypothetical protein
MAEVAQLKRTETAMAALAAQVQSPHLQSRPRWLPGVLQTDYQSANSMVDVILRQTAFMELPTLWWVLTCGS